MQGTQPMLFSGDETTDIGADGSTPVSDDYGAKDSGFTGRVRWVQIDIDKLAEDRPPDLPEERLRIAMASVVIGCAALAGNGVSRRTDAVGRDATRIAARGRSGG